MKEIEFGGQVIEFPDTMSNEEISAILQQAYKSQMPQGLPSQSITEPAKAMYGGALGQIGGGLAGLGRVGVELAKGSDFEQAMLQGAEQVKRTSQELSQPFMPQTQRGMQGMESLAKTMEPVAKGFEAASQYSGDVAFERSGSLKGALGFERTGSPLMGALGYTTPTAILEAIGLTSLRRLMPNVRFLDEAGMPTPQFLAELEKMGLNFEDLASAARMRVPRQATERSTVLGVPKPKESLDPMLAAQAREGSEGALAPIMPRGERTVADPLAKEAIRQWDDSGLIQAVKTASPQTRAEMLKMLDIRRRIEDNKRLAQTTRPTDITGQSAVKRIDYLRNVARDARTQLNDIAQKDLAGKPMNPDPVVNALQNSLAELNVKLDTGPNGIPVPIFEGSQLSANPSSQRIIRTAIRLLSEGGAPDALRFHNLKRQLDELIDYRKSMQGGLTNSGQTILKQLRAALNQELRNVSPQYGQVNDTLSDVLTVFDNLDDISGRRTNIFDPDAGVKLGQEFRKLFSNYGVRGDMLNTVQMLDEMSAKYGGSFDDSIMDLAMFANALDTRFGSVAETSFKGQIEAAQKSQRMGEMAGQVGTQGATATAAEKIMDMYRDLTGVNNAAAYKVMEDLLKRNQQ